MSFEVEGKSRVRAESKCALADIVLVVVRMNEGEASSSGERKGESRWRLQNGRLRLRRGDGFGIAYSQTLDLALPLLQTLPSSKPASMSKQDGQDGHPPPPVRRQSSLLKWQQDVASSSSSSSDAARPRSHDFAPRPQSNNDEASRRPSYLQRQSSRASSASFAGDAGEVYNEARRVFGRGTPSPYFMAAVSFLTSLVQGLPLASMFKVYTYLMCEVYQESGALSSEPAPSSLFGGLPQIPAPPQLPHPPQCNDPRVQKTTSAYAASMATGGALVALVLLNRVTRLSRRIGRKPMLLIPAVGLALGFASFRLAVALPSAYAGAAVLAVAIVCLEASAAGPLKVGLQSYVVDTTSESQRAAALGFIDGAGQLGAFPSSTLGGFLAAVTGYFFAPFYVAVGLAAITFFYVLVLVPESKRHRTHTFIDDWEQSAETRENGEQQHGGQRHDGEEEETADGQREEAAEDTAAIRDSRRVSYTASEQSTSTADPPLGRARRWLRKVNFLAPLGVFAPRRRTPSSPLDVRLLNLALIVVLEEIYQVFLVPTLLLYNSDVLSFDVLSNGYLVSLLQGLRALFLTAVFPPAVAAARRWVSARAKKAKKGARQQGEREPLLGSGGGGETAALASARTKEEERGKLDIFLMVGE